MQWNFTAVQKWIRMGWSPLLSGLVAVGAGKRAGIVKCMTNYYD